MGGWFGWVCESSGPSDSLLLLRTGRWAPIGVGVGFNWNNLHFPLSMFFTVNFSLYADLLLAVREFEIIQLCIVCV